MLPDDRDQVNGFFRILTEKFYYPGTVTFPRESNSGEARSVARGATATGFGWVRGPWGLRYADASIFAARLRWVALRIRLRIRSDFGVASTYSSESMYSIARSRLILSGASN